MARQFGIISNTSGGITGCVLNTVRQSTSAQTAEARGEDGQITDKWFFSREENVSRSGVMDSTELTVKAGDTISYGGKNYGVVSTSMDESSTGAATFAIEATAPDEATIHTYSSSTSSSST